MDLNDRLDIYHTTISPINFVPRTNACKLLMCADAAAQHPIPVHLLANEDSNARESSHMYVEKRVDRDLWDVAIVDISAVSPFVVEPHVVTNPERAGN